MISKHSNLNRVTNIIFDYLKDESDDPIFAVVSTSFFSFLDNLGLTSRCRIQSILIEYIQEDESLSFVISIIHRIFFSSATRSSVNLDSFSWLDWKNRPAKIRHEIDRAFQDVNQDRTSSWGRFNGSSSYYFFEIEEINIIKSIIKDRYPQKKNFSVMDFGAGNFQLGHSIMVDFESAIDLPSDVSLTIVSVRGESYSGSKKVTFGKATHYHIGSCKIEEITSELRELGIELENQLDICWSNWCCRHLVDPVGTFIQIFNMLQPGTGMFFGDGFIFENVGSNFAWKDNYLNSQMVGLLSATGAPFLMQPFDFNRGLNRFLVKRWDHHPCRIPFHYEDVKKVDVDLQIGSERLSLFTKQTSGNHYDVNEKFFIMLPHSYSSLSGSRYLFQWFRKNGLLPEDSFWMPIHITK